MAICHQSSPLKKSIPARNIWKKILQLFSVLCSGKWAWTFSTLKASIADPHVFIAILFEQERKLHCAAIIFYSPHKHNISNSPFGNGLLKSRQLHLLENRCSFLCIFMLSDGTPITKTSFSKLNVVPGEGWILAKSNCQASKPVPLGSIEVLAVNEGSRLFSE